MSVYLTLNKHNVIISPAYQGGWYVRIDGVAVGSIFDRGEDAEALAYTVCGIDPVTRQDKPLTAGDVAGNPDLFSLVYTITGHSHEWECMGYARTERTVRFSRLVAGEVFPQLRIINLWVTPETQVEIVTKVTNVIDQK